MYWAWYVMLYCAWSSFLQNWDRRIINKIYYYYCWKLLSPLQSSRSFQYVIRLISSVNWMPLRTMASYRLTAIRLLHYLRNLMWCTAVHRKCFIKPRNWFFDDSNNYVCELSEVQSRRDDLSSHLIGQLLSLRSATGKVSREYLFVLCKRVGSVQSQSKINKQINNWLWITYQ